MQYTVDLINNNISRDAVGNSVLLKCRNLRREDQEIPDSIVGFFIEKPQLMVAAVIENLTLKQSYMVSYRQNWRRDFLEVETNIKQRMLVCYQTSRGSNLINIIKCIDTNSINLNESTSGPGGSER